jgi:hypothetical protein
MVEGNMTWVHLHLLLNHVPVLGTVSAVLLLAFALVRRSSELTRASLGAFVILGLAAGVVYLTGEPAEERVEHLPGVSERLIEAHEEAAFVAMVLLAAFAVGALVVLLRYRGGRAIPRSVVVGALLLSLVPTGAMAWTANLGGQIRHDEIRSATTDPGGSALIFRGER